MEYYDENDLEIVEVQLEFMGHFNIQTEYHKIPRHILVAYSGGFLNEEVKVEFDRQRNDWLERKIAQLRGIILAIKESISDNDKIPEEIKGLVGTEYWKDLKKTDI